MKKLSTLARSGLASCRRRGHRMSKVTVSRGGTVGQSHCLDCGKWVQFETKPAANSIDIGGPAVALGCTKKKKR